jgi:Xaa-Pro dipeptidase
VSHQRDLLFTADEYWARTEKVRAVLRTQNLDVAIFDEIEALIWLTGYGNSENRWRCVGIPIASDPFYVIRALDAPACRRTSWVDDLRVFADWEDPYALVHEALADRRLDQARIGLDFMSYGMPLGRFEQVKDALPGATFVDVGRVVWELRRNKSHAEIALLRRAARIADESLRRCAAACLPGRTQRSAIRIANDTMLEMGSDLGHPGLISAGHGWDHIHLPMGTEPLVVGDIVHIEVIPRVAGYSARTMRSVVLGQPTGQQARDARLLADMQQRQFDAMRPGALARDVDAVLRDGLFSSGLRQEYGNVTGYSVGVFGLAGASTSDFTRTFHPRADWRLEEGMVFHMYTSAAGISFSETVLVTADGSERLTSLPRELIVNEVPG